MSLYTYRIRFRHINHNHLHHMRSVFSQFLVNMYAKIDSESKLLAENSIHLKDSFRNDKNINDIGKIVLLLSAFTGNNRYMHILEHLENQIYHNFYLQSKIE